MEKEIIITLPSEEIGFVEYKRSFCVEGSFNFYVPDEAILRVNILNKNNSIVRHIECKGKNEPIIIDYPGLITYKEEFDPGKVKMQEFGFPILRVNDINRPNNSINNACIKLWFNDNCFKGIITNASDIAHGALFDDGLNFVDEDGNPYSTLPMGDYKIEVILFDGDIVISKAYKNFVIGTREKQLICRFNPTSHKNKMIDWCKENNIAIIKDLLPGYLDSYLGTWYYHMGILKAYRANDLCLFLNTYVVMFVYLIDPTSTSYETELAYLQTQNKINSRYFEAWHYDIGEANINDLIGTPVKFGEDEYMSICRIDKVNENAKENVYYLDNHAIIDSYIKDYEFNVGDDIQIMGLVRPWQMDENDFLLNDDNTYMINNYPDVIRYEFIIEDNSEVFDRKLLMERIDGNSIGTSVYEFYNLFNIKKEWEGKKIKVNISCIDKKGNISLAKTNIVININ